MISERSSAGDKGVRFGSFAGNGTASRSSGTLLAVVAFGAGGAVDDRLSPRDEHVVARGDAGGS